MTNLKAIIGSATLCAAAMTLLTSYAYKKGREVGMLVGGAALASMAFNSLNNEKDDKEEES